MTTWTEVGEEVTTYEGRGDVDNGYVVPSYVAGNYIAGFPIWSAVDSASTDWS